MKPYEISMDRLRGTPIDTTTALIALVERLEQIAATLSDIDDSLYKLSTIASK